MSESSEKPFRLKFNNAPASMSTLCFSLTPILSDIIMWADETQPMKHLENKLDILRFQYKQIIPEIMELALKCGIEQTYELYVRMVVLRDLVQPALEEVEQTLHTDDDLESAVNLLRRAHCRVYEICYGKLSLAMAKIWLEYMKQEFKTGEVVEKIESDEARKIPRLSEMEIGLILALGTDRLVGRKIAEKTPYNDDSVTKGALANLVRREIFRNYSSGSRDQQGYELTEEYAYLLDELSHD